LLLRKATALAEINDGLSYRSWADPRSGAGEIFAGFWRPNVWWYAPGLAAFLVRRQGLRAVVSLLKFLFKAGAALALKCALPASWVARIKACKESGHVPRKVW
ncbi:MAG TPA: hypothetical protein VD994_10315, partial [Prosthecobacter sp.]|nr:hypothetical protein [Prosthecobacter sp.]